MILREKETQDKVLKGPGCFFSFPEQTPGMFKTKHEVLSHPGIAWAWEKCKNYPGVFEDLSLL